MNQEEIEYERAKARLWLHQWRVEGTTNPPSREACATVLDELAFLTKDRDSWRILAEGVNRRCDALIARRAEEHVEMRRAGEEIRRLAVEKRRLQAIEAAAWHVVSSWVAGSGDAGPIDHAVMRALHEALAALTPTEGCGRECSEGHTYVGSCELAREVCSKCGTAGCAENARISWCDSDQEM